MKKIFIFLLTLTILSCSKEETKTIDYAIFSGNIENPDGGKLSIWDKINNINPVKEIIVNKDGTFNDTISGIKQGYYRFKYGKEVSDVYLKPGFNINLALNPKEFDESIKYTGEGSIENNYLAQKLLNEEALGKKFSSYKYLGTLEETDYVHKMDSIKRLKTDFLNKQQNLDTHFKTLEKASITYDWANSLQVHELYKRFVSKNKDYKASENFYDYEKSLNLEDEDLLEVGSYKRYLNEYYTKKANIIAQNDDSDYQILVLNSISKEVKSPKIKEYLLFVFANNGISYTNDVQAYYNVFMANSIDEDHKKEISEKYNKLIKLSKGNPSPKFVNYENFEGGTTSLDDLKGKYVYIDVWATWCGPCKREIPPLKEVTKNYKEKNIAFVSMSVDKKKDYDKWRKMVKEKELEGYQLFAPNDWKSDFVNDYEIKGIPRFILIDPQGNIVKSNAPRPSSEELIKLFDKLEI